MNMFKKNGGFTLVELIVVIAILAILAGVAIPAYSGYITKAKDAAVISELDAIATAVQAANAEVGEITQIVVTGGNTIVVTSDKALDADFEANFELFYKDVTYTASSKTLVLGTADVIPNWANSSYVTTGATWTNGTGWVVTPSNP